MSDPNEPPIENWWERQPVVDETTIDDWWARQPVSDTAELVRGGPPMPPFYEAMSTPRVATAIHALSIAMSWRFTRGGELLSFEGEAISTGELRVWVAALMRAMGRDLWSAVSWEGKGVAHAFQVAERVAEHDPGVAAGVAAARLRWS